MNKRIVPSLIAGGLVGLTHYLAHQFITTGDVVMKVGATVIVSTIIIAYVGMGWKK